MTLDKSAPEYRFLVSTAIEAALMALYRSELTADVAVRIKSSLHAASDFAVLAKWECALEHAAKAAALAPSDSDVWWTSYAALQVLTAKTPKEARDAFRDAIAKVLSPWPSEQP